MDESEQRRGRTKVETASRERSHYDELFGEETRPKLSVQAIFTTVSLAIIATECLLIIALLGQRAVPTMMEAPPIYIAVGG
jgi:hypothetical protein